MTIKRNPSFWIDRDSGYDKCTAGGSTNMAFSFCQRQSKHEGQEHVNTLLSMGEIVMIEGEGCPKKPITYCNKFRESQYCHLHVLKMTYDHR